MVRVGRGRDRPFWVKDNGIGIAPEFPRFLGQQPLRPAGRSLAGTLVVKALDFEGNQDVPGFHVVFFKSATSLEVYRKC